MIVYYDSGDKPVLRSCFIDSGVHRAAQYRSRAILKLDRRTRGIIRPRSLVYENPRCPDDDDKIIAFDTWSTSGVSRIKRATKGMQVIVVRISATICAHSIPVSPKNRGRIRRAGM